MLLIPLLGLGFAACEKDKEKKKIEYDVTIICKNADTDIPEATLRTNTVRIEEGTYIDAAYIEAEGLAPLIEGYNYISFEGPAAKVGKESKYVLMYSAVEYTLTINYRNFASADVPLADPVTVDVRNKTVVNEAWLRDNAHVKAINGQVFRSIDPTTVTMDGDRSVTVFYDVQKLGLTVKYKLKNDPGLYIADDMLIEDVVYGEVIDEAWLRERDAIKGFEYYNFDSVEPASLTLNAAGEITVWYTAEMLNVRFLYRDVNGGEVRNGYPDDRKIRKGTTVDLNWVRTNNLNKDIHGYEFVRMQNDAVLIDNPTINYVTLLYKRTNGKVKIEYWRDDPFEDAVKITESEVADKYFVDDVIADYEQLVADGAIVAENIPEGYEFARMDPEADITVAEGETIIKAYYKPKDIPVVIRYWKGKKDQVGTTLGAVDEQATIPFGTNAEGEDGYLKLVDLGSIKPEHVPEGYIFDQIDPVHITTEEEGKVVNIYYTNRVPVTIIYYKGAPGVVGTSIYAKDESQEIIYGTEITSYSDLTAYIVPGNIPAGYTFSSMDPATATIDRGGIEIRLYYTEQQP